MKITPDMWLTMDQQLRDLRVENERLTAALDAVTQEHDEQAIAAEDWATTKGENASLRAELDLERAVCLCGCANSDHESYGEDGEACEHEDHECLRVCPAVLEYADGLRAENERLKRVVDAAVRYRETYQNCGADTLPGVLLGAVEQYERRE